MRIPMCRPSMTKAELSAVEEVFASGWLGEGAQTAAFEQALADFTSAPAVVAVNTGTSALHLALMVLGVGPGDEVIVAPLTFVSDPMAVRLCGATPVFADIDPATLCLDPRGLEAHLTPRTRAVLPTDYAGLPADVPGIRRALGDRAIAIVRDAAHSFGSRIGGRPIGLGAGEDATCFSFDPIKNITCGEGGAVVVGTQQLADALRRKKTLGFSAGARPRVPGSAVRVRGVVETGYRYHMSDINAAIGLAQLSRFDGIAERKRKVARRYDALLADCAELKTFERAYDAIVPFIYPVLVPAVLRDGLIERLSRQGIHADLRYPACHEEPLFAEPPSRLPVTEAITKELLCLPIYADLEAAQVDEIVAAVRQYLADQRAVAPQ